MPASDDFVCKRIQPSGQYIAGLANLEYVKAQLGVPPLSEHASEEDEPAILHHPEEVDLDRPASTITASDFALIRDGAFPWYR
jgi:hypothetical protein